MGGKILILICKFLVLSPFLLNGISRVTLFLNRYFFKYRKKVVLQNLKNSFPDKSGEELDRILKRFYTLLVRYFKETLQIGFASKSEISTMVHLTDYAHQQTLRQSKKSTILLASHYGNWEFFTLLPVFFPGCQFIAFYKPVGNKAADLLMQTIRSRYGVKIFPSDHAARVISENKHSVNHYLFIADQTPHNLNGVYWNEFLNQKTPWLNGAEKLAKRMDWPVYYLKLQDNGHGTGYFLDLINIECNSAQSQAGEITEKYAKILETQIKEMPQYWLWSHRRWKRSPNQS